MSYIETNLLNNEHVIHSNRPHRIVFVLPALYALLTLLLYGYLTLYSANSAYRFFGISFDQVLLTILCAMTLLELCRAWILYQYSEYAVTNKRILLKTGWIQRRSIEIFLDKVEAIEVDQSIAGRVFNYGALTVVGTGGSRDPFLYAPDPLLFRKKAQQQIDAARSFPT
jgi:uncharacterized membrane protein YdbT with pleckstrin-like domain